MAMTGEDGEALSREDFADALAERDEILLGLVERVGRLEPGGEVSGGGGSATAEPRPRPWTRQGRDVGEWRALAGWVDEMRAVHGAWEVPACWPAHEGLVCELVGLRALWVAGSTAGGEALASWYQYSWWPFRFRMREARLCAAGHRADPEPVATDSALLALAAGEEVSGDAAVLEERDHAWGDEELVDADPEEACSGGAGERPPGLGMAGVVGDDERDEHDEGEPLEGVAEREHELIDGEEGMHEDPGDPGGEGVEEDDEPDSDGGEVVGRH